MNWFSSIFNPQGAVHDRAVEIAEEIFAIRDAQTDTRADINLFQPKLKSLDEFTAGLSADTGSTSGLAVSHISALEVTAVQQCVRLLAQGLAQPPLKLIKIGEDGSREDATNHKLYDVLAFEPNPEQTSYEFRENIGVHKALAGNSFVRVIRSGGRPVALWPVRPNDVTIHYHKDRSITYDIVGEGKGLSSRDVWQTRGLSWDCFKGLDAVAFARDAIGLAKATEHYGSSLFRNGARPAGIVYLAGKPTPEQISKAASEWNKNYSGLNNANKTAFMGEETAKYLTIGSSANDAQWTDSRRYQIEEICRAFGIRPSMVYTTGATSYASVEQEFLAHVKFTLAPLHTNFEQSATRALLTLEERKAGYRIKLDTNALLRGSVAERMQMYQTMVPLGGMSINEMRKLEDLPAYPGEEFDMPRQAQNVFGKPEEKEEEASSEEPADEQDNENPNNEDEQ